jgi:hypothetical protein
MMRLLVDTNVFLYARGGEHPYRGPCRSALRAGAAGSVNLEVSVEAVQEFAHVLLRRRSDRAEALREIAEMRSLCRVLPFDDDVLRGALDLLGEHSALGARDAVHAATAVNAGIGTMLSTDRVFDGLGALTRLDPTDAKAPWFAHGA